MDPELIVDGPRPSAPAISPDGRWVVYRQAPWGYPGPHPFAELWLVAADGRARPRRLDARPGNLMSPRWAPDSASIFFRSDHASPGTVTSSVRLSMILERLDVPGEMTEVDDGTRSSEEAVPGRKSVQFSVDGLALAGTLHQPGSPTARPAVLVAGPSPQVKEQVPDTYAARLADAGYVALTLDFRNFGESGGRPRLREDPAGKIADLRAATSFLCAQAEVDAERIAIAGICAGAGYALAAAARDPRLAAFAGIAGFYPDPRTLRAAMGEDGYRAALRQAIAVLEKEDLDGEVAYLPHVAPAGGHALIQGGEAYEFYGSARAAAAGYRNEITADTGYTMLTLDTATAADLVTVPALVVHGRHDEACVPDQAAAVYDRLGGTKQLVWLPTDTHIGFYDHESHIGPAVAALVDFLDTTLRER